MKVNDDIYREYDIRGKYKIDYDEEFAFDLGRAFYEICTSFLSNSNNVKIGLGRDARHSSLPLMQSIAKGIMYCGGDVLDLSLITSPVSYFANYEVEDLTGAIMITGSHNPPEYNGFKITLNKNSLTSNDIQNIKSIIHRLPKVDEKKLESITSTPKSYDIISPYVKRLASEFSHLKDVPFTIDCGNGAAGSVARDVFESCGLNPKILFEKPDGDFPNHHPDPTLEENLIDLKKEVRSNNSLFGIGYDGDADRIVVVTQNGRTVFSDELMSLYAKHVLKEHPGAKIIGDVKCSDHFYELVESWKAQPIMWKTGHSLIKKKVLDEESPFGGEFSGHIFFNDRFYGFDDAIYCSLRLIEIVQESGLKTLDELLEFYPKSYSSPEIRIEVGEKEKYEYVEQYSKKVKDLSHKVNLLDGARATFENGWALVRVSNTQPAITLRFEGKSEKDLNEIMRTTFDILNIDISPYI